MGKKVKPKNIVDTDTIELSAMQRENLKNAKLHKAIHGETTKLYGHNDPNVKAWGNKRVKAVKRHVDVIRQKAHKKRANTLNDVSHKVTDKRVRPLPRVQDTITQHKD